MKEPDLDTCSLIFFIKVLLLAFIPETFWDNDIAISVAISLTTFKLSFLALVIPFSASANFFDNFSFELFSKLWISRLLFSVASLMISNAFSLASTIELS